MANINLERALNRWTWEAKKLIDDPISFSQKQGTITDVIVGGVPATGVLEFGMKPGTVQSVAIKVKPAGIAFRIYHYDGFSPIFFKNFSTIKDNIIIFEPPADLASARYRYRLGVKSLNEVVVTLYCAVAPYFSGGN